eukprot:m.42080 g.42080  ORF g.42080 m.42080 type:complete len:455 (-) comp12855_c0_seq1:1095-2459(-)
MSSRTRRTPPALNLGTTRPTRSSARTSTRPKGQKRNAADAKADVDIFDQRYCVCQQPWSAEDSEMIQCDRCEDWFHPECVGLSSVADIPKDDQYHCPRCSSGEADGELDVSSSSNDEYPVSAAEPPSSASSLPKRSKPVDPLSRMDYDPRASPAISITDVAENSFRNLALSPTPFGRSRTANSLPVDPAVEALVQLRSPPTSMSTKPSSSLSHSVTSHDGNRRRSGSLSRAVPMKKTPSSAPRLITSKAKGFDVKPKGQLKAAALVEQLSTSAPTTSDRLSGLNADGDPATKRIFHNERERQRRSTIRTLFEQLRKSVPAIESQEGTSDRQILVEAARHVETLQVESRTLEDDLIRLKLENLKLKMETSAASDHSQLQAQQAELLQLLGETAEIVAMKEELARPVPSSPLKKSSRPGHSAASNSHEASSVGSQGGDLMQLLLVAEQELGELGDA